MGSAPPERRRKLERAPFPDDFPIVRELASGCLYVRYKDRDGRARQKSQNPRKSDIPGVADEYKREAAKMLQAHYTDATGADDESEHEAGAVVGVARGKPVVRCARRGARWCDAVAACGSGGACHASSIVTLAVKSS